MENREVKVWKISVGGTNKIKLHKKAFANKTLYIGFTQIEEKDYHQVNELTEGNILFLSRILI